ncbi:MAG: topoisomerase DNA-binding C4 zinc finger domain-containing protein, partial [Candidatus Eisenbacteria bacterium]
KLLLRAFPDIFTVEFTARMEDNLDSVEEGQKKWVDVVREFYGPFELDLAEAERTKSELKQEVISETGLVCEVCGKKMVKKFGRRGVFLACSGYPACKFTRPTEEDAASIPATKEKCDSCGAPMKVREGKYGRFLSCSRYPECTVTKPLTLGVGCPEAGCGGELVEKRSRAGRVFVGCSRYPECKFATWERPTDTPCPGCGSPVTFEKATKKAGRTLRCLKCGHEQRE